MRAPRDLGVAVDSNRRRPDRLAARRPYTRGVRSHAWIDRRSQALHEAIAAKLDQDVRLLEIARANLRRWLSANPAPALLEWRALLDRMTAAEVSELLRSSEESAARLRQSSPFAGILTPGERQAILDRYESRGT